MECVDWSFCLVHKLSKNDCFAGFCDILVSKPWRTEVGRLSSMASQDAQDPI